MAKALHDYTALLPLIESPPSQLILPGPDTPSAMRAGIYWAVAGGIRSLIQAYGGHSPVAAEIYLTGGDAPALAPVFPEAICWPDMTLEGVRLTAEALSD
jgi:pantothenate kinase type III